MASEAALPPTGRFHELSVASADVRASVEFYERLGFSQAVTADTYAHQYGVLTDGRLFLGLHQWHAATPTLTFVHPGVADCIRQFEALGIELSVRRTGEDVFNEIGFEDPFGQAVRVIEARTYSPVERAAGEVSRCGDFAELSMPAADFAAAQAFWEPLGFVATGETDDPYAHLPLTSDLLDLAFHRPRTAARPLLVFRAPDMQQRIAQLHDLGIACGAPPRGLDSRGNALIEAPEGTALLLLRGGD
jgi:catechol 2,3-dioxygenase-like lactoylglutathione lyase family enzyme